MFDKDECEDCEQGWCYGHMCDGPIACTWPSCDRPVVAVFVLRGLVSGANRRQWFTCGWHNEVIEATIDHLRKRHDSDGVTQLVRHMRA